MCTPGHVEERSQKHYLHLPNLEAIQISINNKWISKFWDIHSMQILCCNENEGTIDGNIDKPPKHYLE